MKILIVDDEEDIRQIARFALSMREQYVVVEAGSGPEAIERAVQENPDAILLDWMMPGMSGMDTLSALKSNPATRTIPVVLLTAKILMGEIKNLKEMGAHGVISKPFDPVTLSDELESILKSE